MPRQTRRFQLGALLLLLAGVALGTIAVRAKEPSYVVPPALERRAIPIAITEEAPAGFTLRTFDVAGICCQGCSGKLYGALLAVEGVHSAAVDATSERASAVVRDDVDPGRLEQALTFDKYTARVRAGSDPTR